MTDLEVVGKVKFETNKLLDMSDSEERGTEKEMTERRLRTNKSHDPSRISEH